MWITGNRPRQACDGIRMNRKHKLFPIPAHQRKASCLTASSWPNTSVLFLGSVLFNPSISLSSVCYSAPNTRRLTFIGNINRFFAIWLLVGFGQWRHSPEVTEEWRRLFPECVEFGPLGLWSSTLWVLLRFWQWFLPLSTSDRKLGGTFLLLASGLFNTFSWFRFVAPWL